MRTDIRAGQALLWTQAPHAGPVMVKATHADDVELYDMERDQFFFAPRRAFERCTTEIKLNDGLRGVDPVQWARELVFWRRAWERCGLNIDR